MKIDDNTTLSHVYGLAGLVLGLVGLVYLFTTDSTWREYALFGSGWVVSAAYAFMLMRCFNQARRDGEVVGSLTERINDLERTLQSRNATLDYVAGLLQGKRATPRASQSVAQNQGNPP